MTRDIHIVDEHGDECVSAETIMDMTEMNRMSPLRFARREARLMSGPDGDFTAPDRLREHEENE